MCERLQLGPRAGAGGGGGGSRASAGSSSSSSAGGSAKVDDAPSLDEIPVINLEDEEIKPEDIPF
jgi:hypothetical protein